MFLKKEKKVKRFERFKDPLYRSEEFVFPGLDKLFDMLRKKDGSK